MFRFSFLLIFMLFLVSCSTQSKVIEDISESETVTGSDWSAKDLRRVARHMSDSLSDSRLVQSPKYKQEKPRWMLARELSNDTDEHINTRTIMEKIRTQMINQELARFVDDQSMDDILSELSLQESALFDPSKALQIGKLIGAKFILRGRISNIRKRSEKQNIVSYNITVQAVNLETRDILWTDDVDIDRKTVRTRFR